MPVTLEKRPEINLLIPTNGAFFFTYLLFLFLFWRPVLLLGDGGMTRHIITGQYILEHHAVPAQNYVWAITPSAPWTTHEIFGDLLLGGAFNLLGVNGVALIAAISIALTITWAYQFGRARGIGNTSGLILLIAVMAACSIHWSARAHVFSYIPFMLCYFLLFMSNAAEKRKTLWLALIMFFWANTHGSYILGLGMIGLKLVTDFLTIQFEKITGPKSAVTSTAADGSNSLAADDSKIGDSKRKMLRWDLIFVVTALVASSLNLRGPEFLTYIFSYASNPMIRFHSDESRLLDLSVGMPAFAFLILGIFVFLIWSISKKKPSLSDFILGTIFFTASIYSMRIIPYFSLLSLTLVGQQWLALRDGLAGSATADPSSGAKIATFAKNPVKKFLQKLAISEQRLDAQELTLLPIQRGVFILSIGAALAFLFVPFLHMSDFDANRLPVQAASQKVYQEAKGLGFNYDNWGDYLYWRNQRPVFIDEKTDFYDQPFLQDYERVYSGGANFESVLDKYKIQWILVPKFLPLVEILPRTPNWKLVYQDDVSAFLQRTNSKPSQSSH